MASTLSTADRQYLLTLLQASDRPLTIEELVIALRERASAGASASA